MLKDYLLALIISFTISVKIYSQVPTPDFDIPITACVNQQIPIDNTTLNATTYNWDFCLSDFSTTPTILANYSNSFAGGYSIKIVEDNGFYYGFVVNNIKLYRVEFGNSLSNNSPNIIDLGDFNGQFVNAEGIDIVKEGAQWVGIIGYGSTSNTGGLIRLVWTDLSLSPSFESLGNFGITGRLRDVKIIKQLGNYILVAPNYNQNLLTRINFGNSLTNAPTIPDVFESLLLPNVSNPITISVTKKNGNWLVLLGSISTKTISVFDLGTDILSEPTHIVSQNFGSFSNFAKMKVARDGTNYYSILTTQNSQIHLVDLKNLKNTDTFVEVAIDGMPVSYGLDLFKKDSKYFIISVQSKLSRIEFEKTCDISLNVSTDTSPYLEFFQGGNYPIDLIAYNNVGDYNFISKNITVSPSQAPQLTSQITGNCQSSPISFEAQQVSGTITDWNWDFGDGGSSTLQNDTYSYASAGVYPIKLNVTDANGCNNLLVDTVYVYNEPIPDFTYPGGDLCMNNTISFTNTSTGETGPVVNWTWDFNGEGASTDKDASFLFTTPGSKTIELKSSIPGCANVVQKVIYVNEAPTVDFSFDNVCNTQTTTFSDLTTGNNLVSWNWDFGDGNNSTDQNPTHVYTNPGQYSVTLVVTNNIGCSTELTQTVYNHNIPEVNFVNELACSSSPIQFTDQSLVQNANLAAWEWNFGDGNVSSDQNPQHLYGQTGDFTVQLKAYSEFGCVDSVKSLVSVIQGPEIDFSWDKSCSESAVLFTDNTNTFGNAVTDRAWIIDSNLKTEQNPTYTFNAPGTYPIQLSVTLSNLCAQSISKDMVVKSPPNVQFGYEEGCGNSGAILYDLTDQSNDLLTSREWRVDGQMLSTDSVFVSQLPPGTYSITLTVSTSSGCEESLTNDITFIGSPLADFSVNTDYGAAPLNVLFTNNSTGGNTYEWSFGDTNNMGSTEPNPTFTYDEIGTYTVTLKTSSGTDCFDETTHTIQVVETDTKAEILTITPNENGGQNNFIITIENTGTTTLGEANNLIFRADYGTEVIEKLNQVIYSGKTVNYTSSFAVPSNAPMESLCVELLDDSGTSLDRNCKAMDVGTIISKPYPNPGRGNIFIDVMLENNSTINVRVLNRAGQVQLSKTYQGAEGLNPLNLDVSGLFQGLYVVEIATDHLTRQFKTTILR